MTQIESITLEWMARPNDPAAVKDPGFNYDHPLTLEIAVHPNRSGRMVIIFPDKGNSKDGYNSVYRDLAEQIQEENLAAVIRSGNPGRWGYTPKVDLQEVLKFADKHAEEITGDKKPEVLLIGVGAGAETVARNAYLYNERISRILLVAPTDDLQSTMEERMKFAGEILVAEKWDNERIYQQISSIFVQRG